MSMSPRSRGHAFEDKPPGLTLGQSGMALAWIGLAWSNFRDSGHRRQRQQRRFERAGHGAVIRAGSTEWLGIRCSETFLNEIDLCPLWLNTALAFSGASGNEAFCFPQAKLELTSCLLAAHDE